MTRQASFVAIAVSALAVVLGVSTAQEPPAKPVDTLVGTLRVHPKFHYRYYIDGFGDGQKCALFQKDESLNSIKPETLIRVQGKLASKHFGDTDVKRSALVATWIVYMDVDAVDVVQNAADIAPPPSARSK